MSAAITSISSSSSSDSFLCPASILKKSQPIPTALSAIRSANPKISFEEIPYDLWWRMGIDRDFHAEGPSCFDADKSQGWKSAWERIKPVLTQIRNTQMTADILCWVHDVLVHDVTTKEKDGTRVPLQKGFSNGKSWAYFFKENEIDSSKKNQLIQEWEADKLFLHPDKRKEISDALLKANENIPAEALAKLVEQETHGYLADCVKRGNQFIIISRFHPGDGAVIDEMFKQFYEEAAQAKTMDAKYAALVRFACRMPFVFHEFPDANGRTINAIMNLLLYQIGSSPAILENPSLFNGSKTVDEMIQGIKEGIEYFQMRKILVTISDYANVSPLYPANKVGGDAKEKNSDGKPIVQDFQDLEDFQMFVQEYGFNSRKYA